MIQEHLLYLFGAEKLFFLKGEQIFNEEQQAVSYYQITKGEVKMNNFNDDGKEFIQGIFLKGQSFGEPPLFSEVKYPANAEALTDCEVLRLSKERFLALLKVHPEEHLKITAALAKRLYYKAIMASELSSQEPEHRILRVLDYLKDHVHNLKEPFSFELDLTRQQIADLTGLRVETVIRATKSLEKKGELKIKNRKLYR
ncbi:MAG: Crp/Fnr family transcriptional regulator [Bacteroidetes bacterium HGW-Bacteroidetes-2]|jgi:CRP-like cAMP-binding protein|nr:MAG: Crp/Fnr family transcriptional regulator [Bacteroidetes bacterium HGW-Bacteroidetes-2]